MSNRKAQKQVNDRKALFVECVKLLARVIELLLVVIGLFLLFKGGFA